MRTEWITDVTRFAALAPAWDKLAARAPAPFLGHSWLAAWWAAFGDGRSLRICVQWRDDELVAAFPLLDSGRRLVTMCNDHTPVFRPLARGEGELTAVAEAVVDRGEELEVSALPKKDPGLDALLEASSRAGWSVVVDHQSLSPVTDSTGDFHAYREGRKKQWRELERRGRKLRREHDVELRSIEAPVDVEREVDEGLRLEASGWKGAAGTAILLSPKLARFYRTVARSYHERGELRLSQLRAGGRLVAFDLAVVYAGRYFLLKTAYDESLAALAPGLVLRRAVIERCFEEELEAHEFLGVDMAWKRLFSTGAHELCVYRGYGRRPLPSLRYAYRKRLRPVLKRAYSHSPQRTI